MRAGGGATTGQAALLAIKTIGMGGKITRGLPDNIKLVA
jgi:hypothetical protein